MREEGELVDMGLFFNRNDNNKKPAQAPGPSPVDAKAAEIRDLILEGKKRHDTQILARIVELFREAVFWVPMTAIISEEDQKQFLNAKEGDRITTNEQIRLRPDFLKGGDGSLFFPAFTSQEETEEKYRDRFSWVQLPGHQINEMTNANAELKGIVINGFSQPCMLPKDLLAVMYGEQVTQHTVGKGSEILLLPADDSCRPMIEAALGFIEKRSDIHKAFFAKMEVDGKPESYCLTIDGKLEDPKRGFGSLNEIMQTTRPDMPIDYCMFPQMADYLQFSEIQPFFIRKGAKKKFEQVSMNEAKTFTISQVVDDQGWTYAASFDFEINDRISYEISTVEAGWLINKLQKMTRLATDNLIVLAGMYLKDVRESSDADKYVKDMLENFDIKYSIKHSIR